MSATTSQHQANSNTQTGVPPVPPEPHQTAVVALRALEGEGTPEYIALGALRLDERNVRKDPPTEEEIGELADLIDAQGLLQNLSVVVYDPPICAKGKSKPKGQVFTHGVIAGGRRWRALLRLVERQRITLDEQILCSVVAAERALAVSAAENSGRKAMSTADTILAFADMVRAGAGTEDLAVCFGLSPLTVQRRLKLANVSPKLFDLFRQEAMTLDQLMALALTDDHKVQEGAWKAAPAHNRTPRALRALIAGESLSRGVIKFVGMKAYQAAGGVVLQDLFAQDQEQVEYVQDPALMMRLATEKLEALCRKAQEKGAAWTESFTSFGYSEREQFADAPTTLRAPTEEEAQALQLVDDELSKLEEELEALYETDEEGDDEGKGSEQIEALEKRSSELQAQRDRALEARREVLPEIAALVGAVLYVDDKGKVNTLHKVRKEDLVSARRSAAKAAAAQGVTVDGMPVEATDPAGAGLSERLCRQLTAHRTRALQASLLRQQHVALAALLHPMLATLIYGPSGHYESPSSLHIRANDCDSQLHTCAPDLEGSRAEIEVTAALDKARKLLPSEAEALLPCLLALDVPALMELLTLASALSLDAISGNAKPNSSDALAAAVRLDMTQWWAPTGAAYLSMVSKQLIAEAVTEVGMGDEAQALAKMKKADAVAKAETLLQGKAWVPALLRR